MTQPLRQRHFVFLQGMPCAFFRRLGASLREQGCRVTRINLSFGDWLFWRGADSIAYRGRYRDWPAFLAAFMAREAVTDLVLLGEQRRYHKEAVRLAQERGIAVTVSDFGYLRPDWVALERDGMGGDSHFPGDFLRLCEQGVRPPPADLTPRYRDSARAMMLGDLAYNFGNLLLGFLFPFYRRSDMRPPTLIYTPASALHLLRTRWRRRADGQRFAALRAAGRPCFLFPLQLDHDFQIVAYSPFSGMAEAIDTVLASFAAHAAADAQLLIKAHPWDAGLHDWGRLIERSTRRLGIGGRVHYFLAGDLDAMIAASSGLVAVNSTAALRALQLGCPVKLLGQAVFDLPGLTSHQALDDFWRAPPAPDMALLQAAIDGMAAMLLVRGVHFSEPGQSAAVAGAAARLLDGSVGRLPR